ncbi:hypothetical protein CTI12_AA473410 [Artemisia annua]|uniref:Ubiquitin-like protease family profile domain-containing protein n=1 Tax=Artemisia annua TaxID=35608 RepID=A0A2U1LLI5_ARTAN|nr:hypothetical protein CTI12_AA473410 [Artemisia annua]
MAKEVNFTEFKGVELVFTPVSNDGHQFVVVFNLKSGDVVMLDSKAAKKVESKKRKKTGFELAKLKSAFDIDGSAADDSKATIVASNCGLFFMRHMETYMGEQFEKYQCGLYADPRKQVAQLNKLRNKYAAKILLSPCNLLSAKILGMMNGK